MGCVSSKLFRQEFENDNNGVRDNKKSNLNHIVSLTSSTYGLLSLETKQQQQSIIESTTTKQRSSPPRETTKPEEINAWELMEGLEEPEEKKPENPTKKSPKMRSSILLKGFGDIDARSPLKFLNRVGSPRKSKTLGGKENSRPMINSNNNNNGLYTPRRPARKAKLSFEKDPIFDPELIESYEKEFFSSSPEVILYTTTLRGIRKTFEDCNKVRTLISSHGVRFFERDVSMDSGFKEELRRVLGGKEIRVPIVYLRGKALGGAEEVIKLEEEGKLGILLEGVPRRELGGDHRSCKGCGGVRFVVCMECSGSCKVVQLDGKSTTRCGKCNENGLVHCPLCRF